MEGNDKMTKIFITSDHHFFHGNIIKYCNRPFKNYKEMNECLIERWNATVGKNDIVFHLGDFAWRGKAKEIRERLNGTIILVKGNHDKFVVAEDGFIVIEGNLIIGRLILSHEPLSARLIPKGYKNVHGHIHDKTSYIGLNVSVERTDYKPILLENCL